MQDKKSFTVSASDLDITWGNDCRYWRWYKEESSCLAELLQVWWLEVKGTFDASKLACNTTYQVSFVVKLKCDTSGWNVPVKLSLSGPDGKPQEKTVNMCSQPSEQWIEIPAGSFKTCAQNCGQIKFSFTETDTNYRKTGLVVKGVKIVPVEPKCGCSGK